MPAARIATTSAPSKNSSLNDFNALSMAVTGMAADEPRPVITNSIGMELVLIPAGEFLMGSPDSDSEANIWEKPQHWVRLSEPFFLGATEVTQEQWRAVMSADPYVPQRVRIESIIDECGGPRPIRTFTVAPADDGVERFAFEAAAREDAQHTQHLAVVHERLPAEAEDAFFFGPARPREPPGVAPRVLHADRVAGGGDRADLPLPDRETPEAAAEP